MGPRFCLPLITTDIAFAATEVLMKAPEVQRFTELIAPEIPPLGIMDLAAQQVSEMPPEQLVLLVAVVASAGYFLLMCGSSDDDE